MPYFLTSLDVMIISHPWTSSVPQTFVACYRSSQKLAFLKKSHQVVYYSISIGFQVALMSIICSPSVVESFLIITLNNVLPDVNIFIFGLLLGNWFRSC